MIIYTTHQTASKTEFINKIKTIDSDVLFIVDEVHNIGSPQFY